MTEPTPARLRVSLVTPATDRSVYLDEAIASVPHDPAIEIEHIVVHDGSVAFRDSLQRRHPHLKITVGPGAGPTPAIAAAFAAATGDFLLELNSDDRLVGDALSRLRERAIARPEVGIWSGGLIVFRTDADGREIVLREVVSRAATELSLANVLDDLPLLNARFFRREVLDRIGNLDTGCPFSCDREFLLRAVLARIPEAALDMTVAALREHEDSATINRRRGWIPPYLAEHVAIADRLLKRTDLTPELRGVFRNWRARETVRLALRQMGAGRVRDALATLGRAQYRDPLWFARATTALRAWVRRRRH